MRSVLAPWRRCPCCILVAGYPLRPDAAARRDRARPRLTAAEFRRPFSRILSPADRSTSAGLAFAHPELQGQLPRRSAARITEEFSDVASTVAHLVVTAVAMFVVLFVARFVAMTQLQRPSGITPYTHCSKLVSRRTTPMPMQGINRIFRGALRCTRFARKLNLTRERFAGLSC